MATHIPSIFEHAEVPKESFLVSSSNQADYWKLGGFHFFNFQESSTK